MSPDGRRHFHEELDDLQKRLLEMAGRAEELLGQAMESLSNGDRALAERVRKGDDAVDAIEIDIDERVLELLALQQPMAVDLRQIVASQKIANDLERVGDHAVSIAKSASRLTETPPFPELREIREMADLSRRMLSDALAAYVARDSGAARLVCRADDRVDDLLRSLYRILVTHMLEDPTLIGTALELLRVAQNLERVADLSTNIAEDVVFLVEGQTIKHHVEER